MGERNPSDPSSSNLLSYRVRGRILGQDNYLSSVLLSDLGILGMEPF